MSDLPEKPPPEENGTPRVTNPELLERFLEVQSRELDIRAQELELRKQESTQAHEFATGSLQAQIGDVKEVRQQQRRDSRYTFILVLVIVIVAGLFTMYSLYLNKEQLVLDILKVLAGAGGGGGIGYAYGFRKAKKEAKQQDN